MPSSPGPEPRRQSPPSQPVRATLHSTEQTRTYPCHQCGGELVFDIKGQRLRCPNCGNTQAIIENAGKRVVKHGLDSREVQGLVALRAEVREKEIVCQNCGGHTTFTGSLTATRCPYCATPVQRDDVHDAPDRLPVDAVLPFRVDEGAGRELVEKWVNSRWFAPTEFKKYRETGSFSSVYVAYFTYDARAESDYAGERGREYQVTVGSGENRRTETRVSWTHVRGHVTNIVNDLPVLANNGMDTAKIVALEPWPTGHAVGFSGEYVAGHLSRTYDLGVEECFGIATERMRGEIEQTVRRDIGGDRQRVHQVSTTWFDRRFQHLLLPIWLLTVVYQGKPFQVCINGITGEVQGRRPISAVKVVAAVLLAITVIVGVYLLTQGMPGR
ncbi:hypothetical protein [Actinokineospora pegani]|uniref:hypothetical protein n=1 Tax=Actinokineospora pegani TaxID=2654637 RepID=UPI0018D32742|nr:hypothetical protein [Actinokineospora pegani]